MANWATRFLERALSSFDNHSKGLSARKLSAFAGVCLGVFVHYILYKMMAKVINEEVAFDTMIYVLAIDFIFVLLCLGIVTIEQVIKLKMEKAKEKANDKPNGEELP